MGRTVAFQSRRSARADRNQALSLQIPCLKRALRSQFLGRVRRARCPVDYDVPPQVQRHWKYGDRNADLGDHERSPCSAEACSWAAVLP